MRAVRSIRQVFAEVGGEVVKFERRVVAEIVNGLPMGIREHENDVRRALGGTGREGEKSEREKESEGQGHGRSDSESAHAWRSVSRGRKELGLDRVRARGARVALP